MTFNKQFPNLISPSNHSSIILSVHSFPKLSETFIVSKFLGLLDIGWDVHIVCARSEEKEWTNFPILLGRRKELRDRIHVRWPVEPRWLVVLLLPLAFLRCVLRRPVQTWRYLKNGVQRFGLDILRRLYLDAELILLAPDIVHYEFGALAVGRMYFKELFQTKISNSFRGHDLLFSGLEDPNYYREVWAQVDAIHLLGEYLWLQAQERGCPPNIPHVLIPPAIDVTQFQPGPSKEKMIGTPDRPLRILSVARLDWAKGHEYALQAIKLLMERGVFCEYRIIGNGNFINAVVYARHQLGLGEHVELLGALSPEEVRDQMRWADVFLYASVQEGFCNAVIEAQAMMLPVVCSDAGGLPENVENDVTGFVVPRRNAQALAEKLAQLSSDPVLRQKFGQAGRRRVEKYFQLPSQIERFNDFYQKVLANDR